MTLFGSIVNRVLNEVEDKQVLKYEDIKSDYVNGPVYVYHMAGKSNLKGGILKSGWESYYNAWNSYDQVFILVFFLLLTQEQGY